MDIRDYNTQDTIAAIATFPCRSALGVIKISGPKAMAIISRIFFPKRKKNIKYAPTYSLHYGWVGKRGKPQSREKTEMIDEVLVSIMRAPHSYTREDVVEISSHGGTVILDNILELIWDEGGRLACPGEFTYRAFVNGRIDLLQAQGVLDVVCSQTQDGARVALRQLRGKSSREIEKVKNSAKKIFESIEASIQFPEEEVEVSRNGIEKKLNSLIRQVEKVVKSSDSADILKKGIQCVLFGKANSGKSTLFNRLLGKERAIVTEIAGTTRDVVEEAIDIQGIPLRIADTAGILAPENLIEEQAMEKSYLKVSQADIILLLFDYSRPIEKYDRFLLEQVEGKNVVIVINKMDLPKKLELSFFKPLKKRIVKISALKNRGLSSLKETIFTNIATGGLEKKDDLIFLARWQKSLFRGILKDLTNALRYFRQGYSVDFLAMPLKEVILKIGKITGEITDKEILNDIFKDFCIGK